MQTVLLGTAQWGLDYGATNKVGRLGDSDLSDLVSTARDVGIDRLDTAGAYGDAEERIADFAADFEIQTKVAAAGLTLDAISDAIRSSIRRLRAESVQTCLVHDWAGLSEEGCRSAAQALEEAREAGRVRAIGVSAYGDAELMTVLDTFGGLDVVQVPASVLDQRLEGSDALAQLRQAGVRIQARSILLQGVALAERSGTPFDNHPDVLALAAAARKVGVSALAACMGYVRSRPWIDEIVVAATSAAELRQIAEVLSAGTPDLDWPALASADPNLVDPRRWTRPI